MLRKAAMAILRTLLLFLLLSIVLSACMPVLIRKHVAADKLDGPRVFTSPGYCGRDSVGYSINDPPISIEVRLDGGQDENHLYMSMGLEGTRGAKLKIENEPFVAIFADGQSASYYPKVTASQVRPHINDVYPYDAGWRVEGQENGILKLKRFDNPLSSTKRVLEEARFDESSKTSTLALPAYYTFSTEQGYLGDVVSLHANIDAHPSDVELKVPKIWVNDKEVSIPKFRFRFIKKWTIEVAAGC